MPELSSDGLCLAGRSGEVLSANDEPSAIETGLLAAMVTLSHTFSEH